MYGRDPQLVTDHKPLLGLLAEDKPIPAMKAARIQRSALTLSSAYEYSPAYRPGTNNANADCMSHLPLEGQESSVVANYVFILELCHAPVTAEDVYAATRRDSVISSLVNQVLKGSELSERSLSEQLSTRFDEFAVEDGALRWGSCVGIPNSLREKALDQAHPGVCRKKVLAQSWCRGSA